MSDATQISAPIVLRDEFGAPWSEQYGDIYASRDGAMPQARHVFLGGNNLPKRWQDKKQFVILENGFGLGGNFLTTLKAWREDPKHCDKLCFVSIEKHPVTAEEILSYADPDLKVEAKELASKWPIRTPGVHQIEFDQGSVVLSLYFMDSVLASRRLSLGFDALYLDGFSPKVNPEMWQPQLLKAFCRYARPGATLATWCVAGAVRRALFEGGFTVEKKTGFGHKASMTVGVYEPRFKTRRMPNVSMPRSDKNENHILIVGAGLSGGALVEEFSRRGWKVTVVDEGCVPASSASAIRWGMLHAQMSADDNRLFRLTRAGFELTLKHLESYPLYFQAEGLFQMAKDDAEYLKWQSLFNEKIPFEMSQNFLELINVKEASRRVGARVKRGGIWHYQAGILNASCWVRERIYRSGATVFSNQRVESISKVSGQWVLWDQTGTKIAQAPYLVIATASDTPRLLGLNFPISDWRGRISLLTEADLSDLKVSVTGKGYALRSPDRWVVTGASYEEDGHEVEDARVVHLDNLKKLSNFFPDLKDATAMGFFDGKRCVAIDRLPIVGAVPQDAFSSDVDCKGLYCCFAMASRAITLSDLAARIIASQIEGEPLPVEADLIASIDPNRFFRKERKS